MIRFFTVALILLSAILEAHSQGSLTLENGQRIPYEKNKISTTAFKITRIKEGKKSKETIPLDSIKFFIEETITYYKKPNPIKELLSKYDFVKQEVSGKINLYQKTITRYVSGQYGGGVYTTEYLYFEKGDRYEYIIIQGTVFKNKKEKINVLRSLIDDDPEILAKLESEDFKLRSENIHKLIKDYNYNSKKKKN
jgi:hypothetical protein